MRKKALCAILSLTMVAAMFTACGDEKKEGGDATKAPTKSADGGESKDPTKGGEDTPADPTKAPDKDKNDPAQVDQQKDGGKVLNIYCWNDEYARRMADHMPGYTASPDYSKDVENSALKDGGKLGDVEVKWHQFANQDGTYQNTLDDKLPNNKKASADEAIDIFLVEADYAGKYVDSEYAASLASVGISLDELSKQYGYTQDAVTDSEGVLKGASWQGCPAVLFYQASVAKEVLGEDDPAKVQEFVKDWAAFNDTAKKLKDAGYLVCQSVMDTYRVYSNNATTTWLEDGKLNLDANLKKWVDDSKKLVDEGYTTTYTLWSDDWNKGFFPEGKVFSYFGPAWFINFCTKADDAKSVSGLGGWRATAGPQKFFWGGTWICVADGTDNAKEVKDIIIKMTTDKDVLKGIIDKDQDFVNNKELIDEIKADYAGFAALGGQNPLPMFADAAETIKLKASYIDQTCNEQFQNYMKQYFDGQMSYNDAIKEFKNVVKTKHPEVDVDGATGF